MIPRLSAKLIKGLLAVVVLLGVVGCRPEPTPAAVTMTATVLPPFPDGDEIVLVTGEFPPYTSETMAGQGVITELVTAVFKEMGRTPHYYFYPWKRAEDDLRQGLAFGAFPYRMTPERAQEFAFSEPLYTARARFFYNRRYHPEGIPFETLTDLKAYTIGGTLGNWYEKPFAEAGLQVEYTASLDQNFEKLYQGRIDLVVEDETSCRFVIEKLYSAEADLFIPVEPPLDQNELRLMVSRKYPDSERLLEAFNAALQRVREKGIERQILEKYGLIQ